MKKKTIFHIGFPKTGTTSIQFFLAAQTQALSEAGILFPVMPGRYRSAGGVKGRSQGPHADMIGHFFAHRNKANSSGIDWNTAFHDFRRNSQHSVMVVSHESQSVKSYKINAQAYRAAIGDSQANFIAYLREPISWLNSYYVQHSMTWGAAPLSPSEFYSVHKYLRLGYEGLLLPFRELGQVKLRSYDRLRANNALLPDFLNLIGAPHLARPGLAAERRNEKPFQPEQVLLLRSLRATECSLEQYKEILKAFRVAARRAQANGLDKDRSPRRLLLPLELQQQITAVWNRERPRLEDRYGLELPSGRPEQGGPPVLAVTAQAAEKMHDQVRDILPPPILAAFETALAHTQGR